MQRDILHLRIDAFPVAVERLRNSALNGKPVVVCSRHSPRSLIFSASPEARTEGVFPGQPLTQALKRCRRLVILPPDDSLYQRAARAIGRILGHYSPLVESAPGRFFADMSGTARLFGGVQDSAWHIRHEVRESVRLSGTVGAGSNKLVSGVAARVAARYSDLCSVPLGSEASFLAPLQVRMLPAVRTKTEKALLSEFNIQWNRQLAAIPPLQLTAVFGRQGALLHRQALGIDNTPVLPPGTKPFVLEETTLPEDSNDDRILLGLLYGMTERACARMRDQGVFPHTVWLHLRYSDGVDITRRLTLKAPTVTDPLLFRLLQPFYLKTSFRRQRIRYLSLTFTDLEFSLNQLALFDRPADHQKADRLVHALDTLREKYGISSIQFGRTMQGTVSPARSGAHP
jgi:DNA polymerase-4